MKRTPINNRSKTNKRKHKTNEPLPPETPCYICGAEATETHELYGGSKGRNDCIDIGFQIAVCRACHFNWHNHMDKAEKDVIRAHKQSVVMSAQGMTVAEFRNKIGRSWIDESEEER